jgi:hypothetical protein
LLLQNQACYASIFISLLKNSFERDSLPIFSPV